MPPDAPRHAFFGELYLRSTLPFFREAITQTEVDFLAARLPAGRLLDVGCGHGRHLRPLGGRVFGVDFDRHSLTLGAPTGRMAQGDLRALPIRTAAFEGAYAWYNTLSTVPRAETVAMLAEVRRCLKGGGLLVVQGSHPARAEEKPTATWAGPLPDGAHLLEETVWSPERRQDEIRRELTLPDGRVMAASFFIRYYALDEWRALLAEAGFEVQWACGGVDGAPVGQHSFDIIVGARNGG